MLRKYSWVLVPCLCHWVTLNIWCIVACYKNLQDHRKNWLFAPKSFRSQRKISGCWKKMLPGTVTWKFCSLELSLPEVNKATSKSSNESVCNRRKRNVLPEIIHRNYLHCFPMSPYRPHLSKADVIRNYVSPNKWSATHSYESANT